MVLGRAPRLLAYQVGESLLHRLDPRTKLLAAGAISAGVLMANGPVGIGLAYALGAVAAIAAWPVLPALWRSLRPLLILIAIFGVIVVVVTPGHALAHIWIVVPTTQGLDLAIRLSLQAALIVYSTSLLTLTTPPLELADALQWTFGWLRRFRVPVEDIIAMVAIGLTFVPLLLEEAQRVIAAQRARGADLGMNVLLDEQSMGALLIPMLLANLRRGEELAESMEARLYATGPRTSLYEHHFQQIDTLVGAVLLLGLTAIAVATFVLR